MPTGSSGSSARWPAYDGHRATGSEAEETGKAQMIDDDEVELEHSPLSGEVSRDGFTVKVEIYRLRGAAESWSLEVVDHEDASTSGAPECT